jgi:hypothetical protein
VRLSIRLEPSAIPTGVPRAAGDIAKVNASGVVDLAGTVNIGWIIQAVLAGTTTARVRLCPTP